VKTRVRVGSLLAAGVLALGVWLWFSRATPALDAARPAPEGTVPATTPGTTASEPPASPTQRAAVVPTEPARVPLLRPPADFYDAGLRPIAQRTEATGPIDRRENPGARAKQQMEMIRYAFETLDDDISECLKQWEALQPGEATQVMIAFEIDENGLQKSWLEHDAGIPFGPRTCLSNAVYGLDWSHIVDHPAKLTNRFELGRDAR
jgi:hypothetical protein